MVQDNDMTDKKKKKSDHKQLFFFTPEGTIHRNTGSLGSIFCVWENPYLVFSVYVKKERTRFLEKSLFFETCLFEDCCSFLDSGISDYLLDDDHNGHAVIIM